MKKQRHAITSNTSRLIMQLGRDFGLTVAEISVIVMMPIEAVEQVMRQLALPPCRTC